MATLTTKYIVPFGVAALIAVPTTSGQVAPAHWQNRSEIKLVDAQASDFNSTSAFASGTRTWSELSASIRSASSNAAGEGTPVSLVAEQLAFQVAASLEIAGNLHPTVSDNEEGGLVFYWKGLAREIQIELDKDGSHFVRIRGGNGEIQFENEGRGPVDTDRVNRAVREWAESRVHQLAGNQIAA